MPRGDIVLSGAEERPLTAIADYRAAGGYVQLAKARLMEPQQVIQELLDSNLRGRGGAFFATGRKASFIPRDSPKPTYLTVNADESEPGTFKDREIMLRVPHRLIEGCLITAHAIRSKNVFIYIRGEYLTEFEIVRAALAEVHAADLLGGVCTGAQARTSAAKRPDCSSRSRASAGSRARSRRSPRSPASTHRRR